MSTSDSQARTPQPPAHAGVPILVRFWEEDEVWNASAFDLPVAVFGDTYADAEKHFEEALDAHFELLEEIGRAKETVNRLREVAAQRGFYPERVRPRELVSSFAVPAEPIVLSAMEECLV